jgi:general secretion pathway protein M
MTFDLAPAADWWAGRTARERVMLTVMLSLIGAIVIWFGVIQPLRHGAEAASEARADAARQLAQATIMARQIETLQKRFGEPRTAQALEALVLESAIQNNVVLDRHQIDGALLTLWAEAADPKTFLAWLTLLQTRSGISVTSFTAIPGPGGRVQIQVALAG